MFLEERLPLIFALIVHFYVGLSEPVKITIADGDIQGLINKTYRNNETYYSFRGIPYAQPPIGDLRFAAPVKNDPWNETYDATYDRNICMQMSSTDDFATTIHGDEDCLYINVYTSDLCGNSPVVVWIYGGAFGLGDSTYDSYGPDNFLDQGIVFVSFNYRLGVFGFLSTADEACPGNWGIKDQILALKWVQENIADFGGNPKNVSIFGQSAGAASVHLLMQTTLARGLFKGAIMNSGSTLDLWALNTRASTVSSLIGIYLGIVSLGNSTKLVEQLRTFDSNTLFNISYTTGLELFLSDGLRGLPWGPVIEPDVEGAVYIHPSDYALRQGNFTPVPVLMGINSNEAGIVVYLPQLLQYYFTYYDLVPSLLTPYSMTDNEISRIVAGGVIKLHYFGLTALTTNGLTNFISADQYNRPIRRAATSMSNYTKVYFYEFGYQGNISGITDRLYDGVGHAEDINYFFRSSNNATETDLKVSNNLLLMWSNFIKYGNPTPSEDEQLNNTIWVPVDPKSSDFNFLSINASLVPSINPKQSDWQFYMNLWERFGDKNEIYTTY